MLNDSVFDLDACVLFQKVRRLRDQDEIKATIILFLHSIGGISSERMRRKFHPTFMTHCIACRHDIGPTATSLLLPSSEWNGGIFHRPEPGQCQISQ